MADQQPSAHSSSPVPLGDILHSAQNLVSMYTSVGQQKMGNQSNISGQSAQEKQQQEDDAVINPNAGEEDMRPEELDREEHDEESQRIQKKAEAHKTGGGPAPPPLTNAEEMVLSLNAGRPIAEGFPGGTSSEQVTPEDSRSAFIKYLYGNICLLEPLVPTEPQAVDDGDDEETVSAATERPTELPVKELYRLLLILKKQQRTCILGPPDTKGRSGNRDSETKAKGTECLVTGEF
ncbi:uncharacterized protein LOC120459725 isoform X1 [Tachysurus ichikawai]